MRALEMSTSTVIFCLFSFVIHRTCAQNGINGTCSNQTQCKSTLTCIGNKCVCTTDQWYDTSSSVCKPTTKSGINGTCSDQTQCESTLTCIGNKCVCTTDQWYDTSSSVCKPKKGYNETCSNQIPCIDNLICNAETPGFCGCPTGQYYNQQDKLCQPKIAFGGDCSASASQCKDTMVCNSTRRCGCDADKYYNPTNDKCEAKISYGVKCSGIQGECKEPSLVCVIYTGAEKRCLCNSNSYRTDNGVCQSIDALKVTITATSRQTEFVVLQWTNNSQRSNVNYIVSGGPNPNMQAGIAGANITGLVPGTKYTFAVVATLPPDQYYPAISQSQDSDVWTSPDIPGSVSGNSLIDDPNPDVTNYSIIFGKSNGNVAKYSMTVTGNGISELQTLPYPPTTSINLSMTFSQLKPGNTYNYSLTAFNGNGDPSKSATGTIVTGPIGAGPVKSLDVKTKNFSADISWFTPERPNGIITGYLVQVNHENKSCMYIIKVPCADCQQNDSTPTNCITNVSDQKYTSAQLQETDRKFELELPNLQPYHMYTVEVTASNFAGAGRKNPRPFTTNEAAAYNIKNVSMSSVRDNTNNTIKLVVDWIPDEITGVTWYYLIITTTQGEEVKKDIVQGYTNTEYTLPNVLASWDYKVQVRAGTKEGNSSWFEPETYRTVLSYPGPVTNFTVKQDTNIAKRLNISFVCPEEKARNGTIKQIDIRQISANSTTDFNQTWNFQLANDPCKQAPYIYTFDSYDMVVQDSYTFEMKIKNAEYEGEFGVPFRLDTTPRVPRLEETENYLGAKLIGPFDKTTAKETTIIMPVCAACLTNTSQGIIRNAGIIVCAGDKKCFETGRAKRSVMEIKDFETFLTWKSAKDDGFKRKYRTTAADFLKTLQDRGQEKDYKYVVGVDPNCDSSTKAAYCNGPLPSGTTFHMSVCACTDAGCDCYDSNEIFVTAAESETPIGAIVGGVLGGLALLVCVCVTVVCVARRTSNTGSENRELHAVNRELGQRKRPWRRCGLVVSEDLEINVITA